MRSVPIIWHIVVNIFVKSLLQNVSNIYYKTRQKFITKRGKILLQNAAILLQNGAGITKHVDFITKCGSYYKMGHNRGLLRCACSTLSARSIVILTLLEKIIS